MKYSKVTEIRKVGVTNLLAVIKVLGGAGKVVELIQKGEWVQALYEGKDELVALTSLDYSALKDELKDVDASEVKLLKEAFKHGLELDDKRVEQMIELMVDGVEEVVSGVLKCKKAVELLNAPKEEEAPKALAAEPVKKKAAKKVKK